MSDIIPSHIENCIDKMLAICSGSTVCYKYNDLVSAVPCIVANTGIIGLFKINQCKDDLGFAQMQVNYGRLLDVNKIENVSHDPYRTKFSSLLPRYQIIFVTIASHPREDI